jgi:PAS domain S-box-containing protein
LNHVLYQLLEPEAFLRKVQEIMDQPEAESLDELRFKDGRVFERHSQPHRVGNRIVGRVWNFHDVTERRRIEEAVRKSEAQLHELADAMPQIVWTALPDGRMEYVNKRWLEHTDPSREQLYIYKAWKMMLHPSDVARALATVHHAFQAGQTFQMEVRIKQKEGGYRWHLARALPVWDEAGRIFRWVGTCTDIEDQKLIEQDLQWAKEQIAHHARYLEARVTERTAKLETTIRSLEGVLYHIAHDLRAPLRTMAGFAQMLVDNQFSQLDDEGRDSVERIIGGARRMDQLIQDLLAYGRLGHLRISFSRVDLEKSVERVLQSLALDIKAKKAEVEVRQPLGTVWADPHVLDQVLNSLIKNALTFVDPKVTPHITIWAQRQNTALRLWIQDNGIGIDMEHWEKIFRVFERLHGTHEYTGTGIGLAIVWKGMERMGGSTGVESEPGAGSRFWLEWPVEPDKKTVSVQETKTSGSAMSP